ncbi:MULTISPECIES: YcxB family protein [Acinetobacter]|uniref:YcxB family protein n=1 Tax=Acinetobacter TaxID=469 RepID=UPI00124DBA06|nr:MULTISPECIES: YcxB family protein [Acinetobacter]MCH7385029.1 YcxB family protein [Acinetobacter dispersus]MCU4338555.1 YcxB family protein [Acinetobacter dispersus]QHH99368.1 YcxB family protein [Acinetobacter dispersus]
MTAKTLYAYTLQPVPYEVSEAEQRQAQLMIWRSTNKFSRKAWMIMIALVVLSLVAAGLIKYYSTYSTVICWVVIIGVALFYLIKRFGLEWYVKRKMTEFPVQEIKGLRLGVQPHGIVMRQKMGLQEGTATIGWKDIYEWYSSPDFILVNFKVKTKGEEQQGAYILPKRMDSKNFSFNTVRKHLNETVGAPKSI